MSAKLVIALFGVKGAGKDYVARSFVDAGFRHEKFAAPLKTAVQALFQLSDAQVHGAPELGAADPRELPSAWGPTPRQILQFIGTEMFQHGLRPLLPDVGREFWARSLVQRVSACQEHRFVVSDMRFPHELDVLRRQPDWRVVAVLVRRNMGMDVSSDEHASETEQDAIVPDYVIDNDGMTAPVFPAGLAALCSAT